jgi:hypothetical protein
VENQEVNLEQTWELQCSKYKCIPAAYWRPLKFNYGSQYEQFLRKRYFEHFTCAAKPWSNKVQVRIDVDDTVLDCFMKNGLKGLRSPQGYRYLIFQRVHERLQMNNATADNADDVDILKPECPPCKNRRLPNLWNDECYH